MSGSGGESRHVRVVLHGRAASRQDLRDAVHEVREAGHRIDVRVTWEAGDGTRLTREAVEDGADTVVAGGGDGTLHEVVQGVVESGADEACSIGLLPLGTANDFARAAGLPLEPLEALRRVVATEPRALDFGRANGRSFVNVATGGVGAEITTETSDEMKDSLGRLAYLLTGLTRFQDIRGAEGTVRAPDLDWEGTFFALAVGNGRQAGGGLELFPAARVDDGLLDVLILPEIASERRARTLVALLREGPAAAERVLSVQTPWLEVDVPEGLQVNLDGEPLDGTSFRFEVDEGALRFHLGDECPLLGDDAPTPSSGRMR